MNRRKAAKLFLLLIAFGLIVVFFEFHLDRFLSVSSLKENEKWIHTIFRDEPVRAIAMYSTGAILFVVCAMPGAALVMLLAGAMFGPLIGTIICSISLSIGAVLSLLSSRFLFRDFVRRRFAKQVARVDKEYRRSGSNYLVAMRLIPVLPYFIANLVFGLTPIGLRRFWLLSLLSSIPAVFIYANAGAEFSKINSLSDILTLRLLLTLSALAALPFMGQVLTRKLLEIRR